ncbi:hypothetical protein GCM10023093_17680 [Nemorincola caseinilytica]|uniref:Uncharacterized protein n=1 Tax=Nemorincola caseinilytica TaxID=2054315 RepID=A0ABP8NGM8_9BACT
MRLTEERTPYLLLDFGEHHEANVVVLRIDDARDTFKKYQELVAEFTAQNKGVARVQFSDDFSHYLHVDTDKYDFLSEWDRDHIYIDGTLEEIEAFIEKNDVFGGDGNYVTVYSNRGVMLHIYDNHDDNRFDEIFTEFIEHLL